MTTAEICALPVREIVREGAACFMWATFPNITEAIKVMEAWGFTYKTAAFVWVKKNRKQGGNFMGLGAYTRANAEVCLLGVTPKPASGSWNCWATCPGWKCSPARGLTAGTPGATKPRKHRRNGKCLIF